MNASPPDTMEDSPTEEKTTKRKKRNRVCGFFHRVCKAVKRPFLCCYSDIGACCSGIDPVPDPESAVPGYSGIKPVPDPESRAVPSSEAMRKIVYSPKCVPSLTPVQEVSSESERSDKDSLQMPKIELSHGSIVSDFKVGKLIASGHFSNVYEGTNVSDDKIKVAIKCIPKRISDFYLVAPGHSKPVPAEVAAMLRLSPACFTIINLQHWVEDERSVMLFMENHEPCQTLKHFILSSDDINEKLACWFMIHAVRAVKYCHDHGVYHGHISSSNFLFNLENLEVKLADFRCARLITSEGFKTTEYQGSAMYMPPEVFTHSIFHAEPADVWALGVLLFEITHRYLPFNSSCETLSSFYISPSLHAECSDLVQKCMQRIPADRLTLGQLQKHHWLMR